MKSVTITMQNNKAARVAIACEFFHPIPMIDDPAFIPDPEKPDEPVPQIPEYGNEVNVKKYLVEHIKKTVARYEQKIAQDAITYNEDEDLIEKV